MANKNVYDESSIKSLEWQEHIRLRPGMYIGKLGDGSYSDDGIYVLVKEVIDNSIDEFLMGVGNKIEINITDDTVTIRDFGRGIPLGKVKEAVGKLNTGGKYDSSAFQRSVGMNGVGTKAVNALSEHFRVVAYRDNKEKEVIFSKGHCRKDGDIKKSKEPSGTLVEFRPDKTIFENYKFRPAFLHQLLANYSYLNVGLKIVCNDKVFQSQNGLPDLLKEKVNSSDQKYPLVHIKSEYLDVCLTQHDDDDKEHYFSFVNGQYTTLGGTHQNAFKEIFVKVIRSFYGKDFDTQDIRSGLVAAISIRIQEPHFESQTKIKLGSENMSPDKTSQSIKNYIQEHFGDLFDKYLHKNSKIAEAIKERILKAEKERKDLLGIKKLAKERNKKANLFNKKLKDCTVHLNSKHKEREKTMLFITEGDSASGSLGSSRNPNFQAVFALKGKIPNTYGKKKRIIYENEELNLLNHAINIEDGLENLRYNKIIISTDADVDGAHIRLLALSFFLQFMPDLIRNGHLYIFETPLFRVRNKEKTIYCYTEEEKQKAQSQLGRNAEITRFKGLGEINPSEFELFIGDDIRLIPIRFIDEDDNKITETLDFYMGKNTPERQEFIIDNLRQIEI